MEKSPSLVYGARLELVYGLIAHRGFESLLLRQVKSYILISQNVAFFVFKQNDTLHAILLAWRDFL